jgi:hypothetical protein
LTLAGLGDLSYLNFSPFSICKVARVHTVALVT